MLVKKKKFNYEFNMNAIALILIITANFCFYTPEMIQWYISMTTVGCIISLLLNFKYFSLKIYASNYILWLTVIYVIFFFYGFSFLQSGKFSWDSFLIRYVENVSLYLAISGLFRWRGENIVTPFSIAGIISIMYLIIKEGAEIISGGVRIGDTLSGNVNTVGFNFGFISLLVTWQYCRNRKKKKNLILLGILALFMLLTGSKKALFIVMLDVVMIFLYQKGNASRWLKLIVAVTVGVYLIFNVPYFYDILGSRVEAMFDTMFGKTSGALNTYSYSTDMREEMIGEAFGLFLQNPIFGGGYNAFMASTITQYEYSHCNYTEMLCNFGLLGTTIFYSKYISNIKFILSNRLFKSRKYRNIAFIGILLMIEMLVADWATVTFSGQCLGYLPVTFTCAALEYVRKKGIVGKNEREKISI